MVGATLAVALACTRSPWHAHGRPGMHAVALAPHWWWNLTVNSTRKRAERNVELMADDENDNNIEEGA